MIVMLRGLSEVVHCLANLVMGVLEGLSSLGEDVANASSAAAFLVE